jgi:hypothetical protein
MKLKTRFVCSSLMLITAACGESKDEELQVASPLDPARAYLVYDVNDTSHHRISELDGSSSELIGPSGGTLFDLTLRADGSMIYGDSYGIQRFVPYTEGEGAHSTLNEMPCVDRVLSFVGVRPDTQAIVHGCLTVTPPNTTIYEGQVEQGACTPDQQPLAVGYGGSLFCAGGVDAGDGVVAAVRAREDGGFLVVVHTNQPDAWSLFQLSGEGVSTKLGDYPPLPATIDGELIIATGGPRPRETALLADGTFYQLALRRDQNGPHELFRHRVGASEAEHLRDVMPPNTKGRLVTGP